MTYAVELTEDAENHLEQIYDYVADRASPETPDRLLENLEATCAELSSPLDRGSIPVELTTPGIADFRELHQSPYRVIDRIFEDTRKVVLYGVFDGRRDMQTQFKHRLLRPRCLCFGRDACSSNLKQPRSPAGPRTFANLSEGTRPCAARTS